MAFTIADATFPKKDGQTSIGEGLQNSHQARGLTQVQLAEATEAGIPPAPALTRPIRSLAEAVGAGKNGAQGEQHGC